MPISTNAENLSSFNTTPSSISPDHLGNDRMAESGPGRSCRKTGTDASICRMRAAYLKGSASLAPGKVKSSNRFSILTDFMTKSDLQTRGIRVSIGLP